MGYLLKEFSCLGMYNHKLGVVILLNLYIVYYKFDNVRNGQ